MWEEQELLYLTTTFSQRLGVGGTAVEFGVKELG
jgi:hypothetical protein